MAFLPPERPRKRRAGIKLIGHGLEVIEAEAAILLVLLLPPWLFENAGHAFARLTDGGHGVPELLFRKWIRFGKPLHRLGERGEGILDFLALLDRGFGGDPNAGDAERIGRLPGEFHQTPLEQSAPWQRRRPGPVGCLGSLGLGKKQGRAFREDELLVAEAAELLAVDLRGLLALGEIPCAQFRIFLEQLAEPLEDFALEFQLRDLRLNLIIAQFHFQLCIGTGTAIALTGRHVLDGDCVHLLELMGELEDFLVFDHLLELLLVFLNQADHPTEPLIGKLQVFPHLHGISRLRSLGDRPNGGCEAGLGHRFRLQAEEGVRSPLAAGAKFFRRFHSFLHSGNDFRRLRDHESRVFPSRRRLAQRGDQPAPCLCTFKDEIEDFLDGDLLLLRAITGDAVLRILIHRDLGGTGFRLAVLRLGEIQLPLLDVRLFAELLHGLAQFLLDLLQALLRDSFLACLLG